MLSVNCRLISDAVRIAGRGRHGASTPRSRSTSFGLGRRELPSEQPSGKKLSNQFRGSTCCSTERVGRLGVRPYERKNASFFEFMPRRSRLQNTCLQIWLLLYSVNRIIQCRSVLNVQFAIPEKPNHRIHKYHMQVKDFSTRHDAHRNLHRIPLKN